MDTTNEGVSIADRLNNYLAPELPPETAEIAEEEVEVPEAEVEETELQASEEIEAAEAEEIETDEGQGAEEESETLELSDLAQYLGIEEDKLELSDDGLSFKTKVDGEEGKANLANLLKSYQLEGHLNKQNIAVTEKQKALEAKEQEIERVAGERLNQLEDLSKMAYNKLLSEYNSVNWQELRDDDPAEFAAKQSDFQRAQGEINQAYNQVQAERQRNEAKKQEDMTQYLQAQAEKMSTSIPGWDNPETASSEKAEIVKYADSLGYSPEEISTISDYRVVSMLRKSMMYDKLQSQKPITEKKVRKAPKLVKPGQSVSKKSRSAKEVDDARNRIKKTGGKSGVVDYLLKTGIV